jgi:hypothetical protein
MGLIDIPTTNLFGFAAALKPWSMWPMATGVVLPLPTPTPTDVRTMASNNRR